MEGKFSGTVWATFANYMAIDKSYTNIKSLVIRWWSIKNNNIVYKKLFKLYISLFVRSCGNIDVPANKVGRSLTSPG